MPLGLLDIQLIHIVLAICIPVALLLQRVYSSSVPGISPIAGHMVLGRLA